MLVTEALLNIRTQTEVAILSVSDPKKKKPVVPLPIEQILKAMPG